MAILWRGWLALVALVLGVGGAMSAQAAWRAMAAQPLVAQAVPPPATGGEAEDQLLGAARLDAAATPSAPLGATGTTTLPPLPIPAAVADALAMAEQGGAQQGVVPAAPFSLGRADGADRARALQCLADAIYYEAASEPDEGQRAVAQVILNRVRHPAFPATVCGVVYQGSERGGCQFSFACDGSMGRVPQRSAWLRAARAAAAALAGYVYAPVGLATHYHTYAVTPAWNRSLVMTDAVGAHFFHRWKGYWGTAAAFHQLYAGGEPLPGPHTPAAVPAPLAVAAMPVAPTSLATIRPAYAQISIAPAAPVVADSLPPAPVVLDRWKDSGKAL